MDYNSEAYDLVLKLHGLIENQQKEIKKLQSQVQVLRTQNEKLRRERDDLRAKNSDLFAQMIEQAHINYQDEPAFEGEPLKPPQPPAQETEKHGKTFAEIEHDVDSADNRPNTPPVLGSTLRRKKRGATVRLGNKDLNSFVGKPEDSDTVYPISPSRSPPHLRIQQEEASQMSITSSDFSSNEDGSTSSVDMEASISPTPDSPTSVISTLPDTPNIKPLRGRRAVSTVTPPSFQYDFTREEETEDVDFNFSKSAFRSRVATVSGQAARMTKPKLKPEKTDKKARSLQRRNSFPRRGHRSNVYDVNYLSPDMEMRIQQMIQMALGKKYGGLERATRAAILIQTAYRKFKNVQHFKRLRQLQQDTMQRRRTMSIKYPHRRRPTMISRKSKTVNKDVDQMVQVKSMYKSLTQPKLSPNISRRELHTMNSSSQTRSPLCSQTNITLEQKDQLEATSTSQTSGQLPNQLSMIDEDLEGDLQYEEVSEIEMTYNEHQADANSPSHSIFSGLSSSTIQKMFSASHPIIVQQRESASTLRRKTIIGANIFNRHPQRGIQYLVFEGVLDDSPHAVAYFLNTYYDISKEKIGEFVGEIRSEFNMAVLECLVEMIDLADKTIDEAIRDFQKLFRMPGEAQKIDKIMQVFASEYYKHNQSNVIKSDDAAYILSFAIMMLHTDLHNPSVKRHMTKQEWIKMNRGTNDEEDFPESFLVEIYNRIQQKEFETGKDHTHQVSEIRKQINGHGIPPLANPQRRFIHQCEVAQVNDTHKRNVRRHRRTLFVFNDVVLVTKQVGVQKFEFRKAFTLLHAQAMNFNTQHYKYGVYLQHEMSGETYHCNCDSEGDRTRLLARLSEAISELAEMESERISDFAYKGKNGALQKGGSHTMKAESKTGDLISSVTISSSAQNLRSMSTGGADFKHSGKSKSKRDSNKRSSKDSGIGSPHTTSPTSNGPLTSPISPPYLLSPQRANGIGHMIWSRSRSRSKSPEPPRSRTPEPPRKMTVIPDSRSLTLRPRKKESPTPQPPSSPSHKTKLVNRLSVPIDLHGTSGDKSRKSKKKKQDSKHTT